MVVLVTDHVREELRFDAIQLAVGKPKANVGFAGLSITEKDGEPHWTAIVRNYDNQPVEREWFLSVDNQRSPFQKIGLAAEEIRSIQGPFPENAKFCTLHLKADAFTPDDVLAHGSP